jgi:uncharacterized protein YecE (DUF72 family)
MVEYYIGTMGFSYRDWVGAFYPNGMATRDFLPYYGSIFNAVEIDSTFYGIPRREAVLRWRDSTPDNFKICVKVPRSITHEAGLINASLEMNRFIETIQNLDEKLGAIIFQFPPSYTADQFDTVNNFLGELPNDYDLAIEFRHRSWYTAQTTKMLRTHNVCWVATEFEGVPKKVDLTTEMLLIRFIGQHGRFNRHDEEQIDVSAQLSWWQQRLLSVSDQVHTVYGFFNDDYSGHAPGAANKFKRLLSLPVINKEQPKQMKLF